ncbi:type II toxin-antitoxin system RelE/ParE family toxin [Desulfococcus sp.]|uniref:type II toxin-antitoxin system RelE family toxin n=1 Tax=Desulfococcus sp. TaxID=2025834 RepID=UPI0035944678
MSYDLKFLPSALKEWHKLATEIKAQFKTHLVRRLENPHIETARIRGYRNHYKIKLRSVGYRLVYEADDKEITIFVICVGRRDSIYKSLKKRKRTP